MKRKGKTLLLLFTAFSLFIVFANYKTLFKPVSQEFDNEVTEKEKVDVPNVNQADKDVNKESVETITQVVNLPEEPLFSKHMNIVAIGDSITRGVGDETKNFGYVGILQSTLNTKNQLVTLYNHGVTGNRSDQLLKRLNNPEVIADIKKADTVLITIGANDILQIFKENFLDLHLEQFSDEENEYRKRLTKIIQSIKKTNQQSSIYLIGFYNPFKTFFADIDEVDYIVDFWNNIGYEVTTEFDNVYYIPTKDLYSGAANTYLSDDNFHLNHDGYQKMADRILDSLMNNEGNMYEQLEQ